MALSLTGLGSPTVVPRAAAFAAAGTVRSSPIQPNAACRAAALAAQRRTDPARAAAAKSRFRRRITTVGPMAAAKMTTAGTATTATFDAQQQRRSSTSIDGAAAARGGAVALAHVEFGGGGGQDGPGAGAAVSSPPPVLLLHGLLGNKRNFATVANSLSNQLRQRRRLYGLDLRNHGDNHHDWRHDMTYPSMARDVVSWMDQNQIERAVLVGHSMGGKVAQAAALLHPDRVDGLVVLDIAPVRYTGSADPSWKAVGDIVDVLASLDVSPGTSRSHVDQQLRSAVADPALRAFCLTNLDPKAGRWKIPLHTIASNLPHLADFDLSSASPTPRGEQERQYLGDAFFIHGGQSRFVRSSHIPTIASYFPNHLLTTIRGAGHWIHAEAPDDTTALLKKFLDR